MLTLKYLRYWHTRFNKIVFKGQLSKPEIVIEDAGKGHAGWCEQLNPIKIIIDSKLTPHEARIILLHEMVHQWQFENHQPPGHGPSFKQWEAPCKLLTGLPLWL